MKSDKLKTSSTGVLMILIGILVLVPVALIPFYREDAIYFKAFLIPSVFSILLGIVINLIAGNNKHRDDTFKHSMKNNSLTILFIWIWGIIIGALPFIIGNQLNILHALFEAVSGWTTTGLSVMDVSKTPEIYLFHRSFMQYCGGLGFVMIMILFYSEKQSMSLYSAEGHPDKLMPNLKKTARIIFFMYNIFLVIGTALYTLAGMKFIDSLIHTMCALSTGGFSTKVNSIGEYDSAVINIITIVLMIIGTTNFGALLLIFKGKIKDFFKISEIRFMFALLLITIPMVAFNVSHALNIPILRSFRQTSLDVVSAVSTTGFSSMSYTKWPGFSLGIMIIVMLIGGGVGSTAGGMKLSRVSIMLKVLILNLKKKINPAQKVNIMYYQKAKEKVKIDNDTILDTVSYILTYFIIFMIGTAGILLTCDCSLTDAMFEFSSSLSTVGLSIGITGSATPDATLIVEMVGMLLGRLEVFAVFIAIYYTADDIITKTRKIFAR